MEIKGIPLSHITMHYWLCCPLFLTEVYNVAKLELSDDSKLKLNILKEQEEMIEEKMKEKRTLLLKLKIRSN